MPVEWYLKRRLKKGKEHPERWRERKGIYEIPRPKGKLLWCHGASVGESLSLLPILKQLRQQYPLLQVLVTTGTVTSAALMEQRLPKPYFHQFIPMDKPKWVQRFVEHWRPDVALWLESELWPNLIKTTAKQGIPMLLLNGRLSEKSQQRWQKVAPVARNLLNRFKVILAQSEEDAARFSKLAGKPIASMGNLKWDAAPLEADSQAFTELQAIIGKRPCWLAASTHPGEEEYIMRAHDMLQADHPDVLTIILPRHPQRGEAVAETVAPYIVKRRSLGELPDNNTAFYVADTMGETGLFYRLCEVSFIGGSLVPHGGQNMLEPALLNTAILYGPHTFNFNEITASFAEHNAAKVVEEPRDIADYIHAFWRQPALLKQQQQAAKTAAQSKQGAMKQALAALQPYLSAAANNTSAKTTKEPLDNASA